MRAVFKINLPDQKRFMQRRRACLYQKVTPRCADAGLRFGVQMDRDGPGIVLLDYELITAEDASARAEGWKKLGIRCYCCCCC